MEISRDGNASGWKMPVDGKSRDGKDAERNHRWSNHWLVQLSIRNDVALLFLRYLLFLF